MPNRDTDTRFVTLVDLPLLRRLNDKTIILDSELIFTNDMSDVLGSFISSVVLPQRGLYTLVSRSDAQQVVGQFRLRADDNLAHVVYVASQSLALPDDSAWLHLLDAMARESGKHGAHALIAEVEDSSPLFETMRNCGYAVYARQDIWRREPQTIAPRYVTDIRLREETEQDIAGVNRLIADTVPNLLQQYALPPADMPRLVYHHNGRVQGYIAYSEGKQGIYIIPYLHPDSFSEADEILSEAIRMIPRSERIPVYVCVRRYQDWISDALARMQFSPCMHQAVMVKHIAAGVRTAKYSLPHKQLATAANRAKPPGVPMVQWREKQNPSTE